MEIRTKIIIVDERGEPFMGPGVLQLLRQIQEHKSINRAAEHMNLSYVKALKMLNRLEADLGRRFLVRRRGGNHGGGTGITRFGKRYIAEYGRLQKRVHARAEREFRILQNRMTEGESD